MHKIVILGAGYAGLMTALRLQPTIARGAAQVTLINAQPTFTERIRLHQHAAGETPFTLSLRDFLQGTGIHFLQDYVEAIHPTAQRVQLRDQQMPYDTLVIALGSHVEQQSVPGIADYAHTLDAPHISALHAQLTRGGRVLIIGGGLTGIEAAAEFAALPAADVHLLTASDIGTGLSTQGQAYLRQRLRYNGVTLHEHIRVQDIQHGYVNTEAGKLDFNLCVWAGGFRASPLMEAAGLPVNTHGQVRLRETLQSVGYDTIYAVGDAGAVTMHDGRTLRMACATAMPMGVHAAANIGRTLDGLPLQPFRFGATVQCISLGRHDALVQFLQADDTPTQHILTGRVGALVKEGICRFTIWALRLEKHLPGSYRYPQGIPADHPAALTIEPETR